MILDNLLIALASILNTILTIFLWLIIIRALLSWFSPDPYNPLFQFLFRITEPILGPVRNTIPYLGGIDISPIVVLLAIEFLRSFIVPTLLQLAHTL